MAETVFHYCRISSLRIFKIISLFSSIKGLTDNPLWCFILNVVGAFNSILGRYTNANKCKTDKFSSILSSLKKIINSAHWQRLRRRVWRKQNSLMSIGMFKLQLVAHQFQQLIDILQYRCTAIYYTFISSGENQIK